ncbi:MAG: ATP-binding cassette domain-containing protein [Oscillospiraceae bacterium]|nr:ATP-binding cassette domain-containing protein [Oscillospiraceae bacterium]
MEEFGTQGYRPQQPIISGKMSMTIFEGKKPPRIVNLNSFGKGCLRFGRGPGNDITVESVLVSAHPSHAQLSLVNGIWRITDLNSTNGLICNNAYIKTRSLADGDMIRIDTRDRSRGKGDGVLLVFSTGENTRNWRCAPLKGQLTIGRSRDCDIVLPQISVSKHHARISFRNNTWILEDTNSTNGVILNGRQLTAQTILHEKDVISITDSHLIFTSGGVYYRAEVKGISVDVADVIITRGRGGKEVITGDHITLNVRPGELVAIIGGSGAGKSTILNCMCGYLEPALGGVYINGTNLYENFETLKKTFGYVPQSDIVYNNLTLWDMLLYTAKLRLPQDISAEERDAAILRAIRTVDLEERRDHMIGKLSGGQRKRASIAVELLSDPKLLFLDEPASGLDPGTERSLMQSLRAMADSGKTIVLVTHSTLQLRMCDKIAFMGKGGKLCFYGSYDEAMRFFGVKDIVDVYEPLTNCSAELNARYRRYAPPLGTPRPGEVPKQKRAPTGRQLRALCSRYLRLVINDRQRLLLLLLQAPLLALLISFVANGKQFEEYEMTKSLLFALSCSAFWIGILNAIQEICKERTILKREYMTGLSLGTYLCSKILIMGLMCLIQSLLTVSVFVLLVGSPEKGIVLGAFPELLLVTFLTALSASAMGLFVSALFTNADRAMTVAPILLMPQILFSGLLFKLEGITEAISWFAVCRWSMEGYGTTADLNELPKRMALEGYPIPHEAEDFFEHTPEHFWRVCAILFAFTIGFLLLARLVLRRLKKEGA